MHVADHKFDSRLNFTSEINERYEETDTALEPLSSLATWFTCNNAGRLPHPATVKRPFLSISFHFYAPAVPLVLDWNLVFVPCPKTIKKHNMSLAQHCFSLWFPPASLSELGLWAPCSATTTAVLQGFRALDST